MNKELPEKSSEGLNEENGGEANGDSVNQHLKIGGDFNYHESDLKELRRLADYSPELALGVLINDNKADERRHESYRMGLVCAVLLVGFGLTAITYLFVNLGVASGIVATLFLLALALFVRVILTGEWSETSWIGKLVDSLSRLLGSRHKDGSNGDS